MLRLHICVLVISSLFFIDKKELEKMVTDENLEEKENIGNKRYRKSIAIKNDNINKNETKNYDNNVGTERNNNKINNNKK